MIFFDGFGGGESGNYEVYNRESEESDDETDNSIEDGVFGVGDLFAVATRDDIFDAADDEHDYSDNANDVEDSISDLFKDAGVTEKIGRTAIATGSLGALLERERRNRRKTSEANDRGGEN